jgi:hypothetical protein
MTKLVRIAFVERFKYLERKIKLSFNLFVSIFKYRDHGQQITEWKLTLLPALSVLDAFISSYTYVLFLHMVLDRDER